jgi:hypothetical protein
MSVELKFGELPWAKSFERLFGFHLQEIDIAMEQVILDNL